MMAAPYAALVGLLFAVALWLILRRSVIDLIFGLIVLSHAANLLVFGGGGLVRGAAPLMGLEGASESISDPIPQALVLTAIVIGFGVVAFAIVLVARLYAAFGTDDSDAMGQKRD